jgi:hypothetical protein
VIPIGSTIETEIRPRDDVVKKRVVAPSSGFGAAPVATIDPPRSTERSGSV